MPMTTEDWWVLWDAYTTGDMDALQRTMEAHGGTRAHDWTRLPPGLWQAPEVLGFLRATHPLQHLHMEWRPVRNAVRAAWGVVHYSPRGSLSPSMVRTACGRLLRTDKAKVVTVRGLASCNQCRQAEPIGRQAQPRDRLTIDVGALDYTDTSSD